MSTPSGPGNVYGLKIPDVVENLRFKATVKRLGTSNQAYLLKALRRQMLEDAPKAIQLGRQEQHDFEAETLRLARELQDLVDRPSRGGDENVTEHSDKTDAREPDIDEVLRLASLANSIDPTG